MSEPRAVHRLSVVIPVYQGERTLEALVEEIRPLTVATPTPAGHSLQVTELILVHDGAADNSHEVMRSLAARHPFILLIWLSRNYGQHPATIAGLASTTTDWVVTLDEDGLHDPADIPKLLDLALERAVPLVYAKPLNPPPHGWMRNALSGLTKLACSWLVGSRRLGQFNSFRLIRGEVARSLAAYCGNGVFLDVALSWVVPDCAAAPLRLRPERGRPSGYSFLKLTSHFWRLILTSGTRPLRFIALLGCLSILLGLGISGYVLWEKLRHEVPVQGWTSLVVVISIFSGMILFALGVLAEYLGLALTMAMGKPLYLIVSEPSRKDPRTP